MSDEDVYTLPDLAKKVRHGRRREREVEMEDRGEREERIVDIYVSTDDPGTQRHAVQRNNTAQAEQHGASDETKKNHSRMAAGCLLLLCLLLLAAIIGLVIYYFELIKEKNSNLANERDKLQSSFDQLESRLSNLTEEKAQLQTRYDNLIERDDIKRIICESVGFTFGGGLCYYISIVEKNWEEGRQYCRDSQSDLMVINSKEKQDLVERLDQRVWLGLTDRVREGIWMWVDGTPLTEPTYWFVPQPNGNGDCLEFINWGGSMRGWNDKNCSLVNRWICVRDIY